VGRFKVVKDQKQADLMLGLSANPYHAGHLVLADGQTATIHNNGEVEVDPVPTHNKGAAVRVAYLTGSDPATGESPWRHPNVRGELVTGFHRVGELRLSKLRKQIEK
jgi:hypothetical protein